MPSTDTPAETPPETAANVPSAPPALTPHHITVQRTARYYLLGTPSGAVRDIWVACHGYGTLAASFAEPFRAAEDESRLIVVPEALSRFYLDTRPLPKAHATGAVGALWMTREDRDAEIRDIVVYLDALAGQLFQQLEPWGLARDRVRVRALGFSQGGPTVCRWAALGHTLVDHIVVWGSSLPHDVDLRAMAQRRAGFRMDVIYGERDEYVTPKVVAEQRGLLDEAGIDYQVQTFGGGHSLSREMLRQVMAA